MKLLFIFALVVSVCVFGSAFAKRVQVEDEDVDELVSILVDASAEAGGVACAMARELGKHLTFYELHENHAVDRLLSEMYGLCVEVVGDVVEIEDSILRANRTNTAAFFRAVEDCAPSAKAVLQIVTEAAERIVAAVEFVPELITAVRELIGGYLETRRPNLAALGMNSGAVEIFKALGIPPSIIEHTTNFVFVCGEIVSIAFQTVFRFVWLSYTPTLFPAL